ncbi:hypothetical protein DW884_18685 [Ruminococcus sp. AM40-10AC]|nr:hypothetical protein DW884_18685 [Ruminococcus sp. AM40-10AC]
MASNISLSFFYFFLFFVLYFFCFFFPIFYLLLLHPICRIFIVFVFFLRISTKNSIHYWML